MPLLPALPALCPTSDAHVIWKKSEAPAPVSRTPTEAGRWSSAAGSVRPTPRPPGPGAGEEGRVETTDSDDRAWPHPQPVLGPLVKARSSSPLDRALWSR